MGFLAPVVHIRDNLELGPSSYRITLKGVEIGQGEVQQGKFLAINPGGQAGYSGTQLPGIPTVDPTFACRPCGSAPMCATAPGRGLHRGRLQHGHRHPRQSVDLHP